MIDVQGARRQRRHMSQRLIEGDLLISAGDLLPFQAGRGGQRLGVGVKALVKESYDDERAVAAPRGSLSKALEHVYVIALWVQGRVFKELAEFVEHKEQA